MGAEKLFFTEWVDSSLAFGAENASAEKLAIGSGYETRANLTYHAKRKPINAIQINKGWARYGVQVWCGAVVP